MPGSRAGCNGLGIVLPDCTLVLNRSKILKCLASYEQHQRCSVLASVPTRATWCVAIAGSWHGKRVAVKIMQVCSCDVG